MKNVGFLLLVTIIGFSCSSEKKDVKSEQTASKAVAEQKVINNVESMSVSAVNKIDAAAKKVLNKKINAETFSSDMNVIEKSRLYSQNICDALRQSYQTSRGYSSNSWTMTYKEALEAAKKGIEKAKMIDNLSNNSKQSNL